MAMPWEEIMKFPATFPFRCDVHKSSLDRECGQYVVSARNEPGWKSGKFKSRDAYFLLNMDTAYAVNKNLSVQFSIYNILDREYYDQESASDKYYAGDGRTFTLFCAILFLKINFG